ncbi:hypothetical protein [Fimbriiglobus ruber]|uniref:DUF2029 domain-containing protein n=1 Tax=Fimbriiglobus ruber TaxID=1908690 RepID=A0A225D647_9BACT|nr:hypothetical protein [Fimbriiglobus ruber]OWK36453.1 hypothetical protein FRUB_09016 [Fimbriiglobus ruber]
MPQSIFFDFNLPNSATWFYFALFLAIALFFQFTRFFSLRNWDLLGLFLFVPGFLLIQESHQLSTTQPAVGQGSVATNTGDAPKPEVGDGRAERERLIGYGWLLGASLFWFVRCLIDLATIRRPLITPNLTTPALFLFGAALFVCLSAVAFSRPSNPWDDTVGKRPAVLASVQAGAAHMVAQTQPAGPAAWSDAMFWVERTFAMVCHAAVVTALVLIGAKQFNDTPTGVAAGIIYLLIPYTAFHVGQVHHVWPAALVVWSVYTFRRPLLAGSLMGVAIGTTFFPVLLLPVWLQFYRGRGTGRFLLGLSVTSVVGLAATLLLVKTTGQFPDGVWRTLNLSDWQPWKVPTAESIWTGANWAYRLPVFIVYAGFVITSFLWPPVRNLGQLVAVSAAVQIGVQFWFADRGGLYVLWYAPLLVLVVLRPNLADLQPPLPRPWPRFVVRVGRWLLNRIPTGGITRRVPVMAIR